MTTKRGTPISFNVMKNMKSAGGFGSTYGQDVEPDGSYVSKMDGNQLPPNDSRNKWISGKASLKQPMYIKVDNDTLVKWKYELSKMYDGKKKKSLTAAMKKDGYDSIITYDKYGVGEIIIFDRSRIKWNK